MTWKAVLSLCLVGYAGLILALANEGLKRRAVTAERDGLIAWAEQVCGVADAEGPAESSFKQGKRSEWGRACFTAVSALLQFKSETLAATNGVLAKEIVAQKAAAEADALAARRDRDRAIANLDRLRRARANVQPNATIPAEFWAAANQSAGLRDEDPAGASGAGGGGAGGADPAG